MKYINNDYTSGTRGFTVTELIVSVGLFSIVMTIGIGALLTIVDANKKTRSIQDVMTNLSFAIDDMTREIRVGSTYRCAPGEGAAVQPRDCAGGRDQIKFEAHDGDSGDSGDQIIYRLNAGRIEKSENNGGTFFPVTSEDVTIQDLTFHVTGARDLFNSPSDDRQPRVVITLSGVAQPGTEFETSFQLQTTVVQRLLDLETPGS